LVNPKQSTGRPAGFVLAGRSVSDLCISHASHPYLLAHLHPSQSSVFLFPAFGFPTMFFSIPPLMEPIPTVLAFSVEVVATGVGLRTVLAMIVNGAIEIGFGFFDGMLAFRSVIGMGGAWSRDE
jgi:hypothetical protein